MRTRATGRRRGLRAGLGLLAAGALLLAATPGAFADAPQLGHLKAYFPGDGSTTEVINNAAGSVQGGATFTANGARGQAFSLDGTGDAIEYSAAPWQYPAGDFSIVAWIKTTQATGSMIVIEEYECAGFCPGNDASSMWRLGVDNGKAVGIVREGGTAAGAVEIAGAASVADGAWHHIAFVRDTTANKGLVYVDGALSGSMDLTADMDGPIVNADGDNDPVVIGAHITGGTSNLEQFFNGAIDEVGFYDTALSLTDVQGLQALATDGVAGLRLDNHTPTAVDDHVSVAENALNAIISPENNDIDAESDPLTMIANSKASHGDVSCDAETCHYTPAADYVGTDSFTYDVTDGDGTHATATVFITVGAAESSTPPSTAPSTAPSNAPTSKPTQTPTLPNTATTATTDAGSSAGWIWPSALVVGGLLLGIAILAPRRGARREPDTMR